MEMVDIIDTEGRTVATVSRQEMRGRRLPHRAVYILVFNRRGELFVHLRTLTKDVYPGYWDVAIGGVLAAGESFDQGAVREGREELGVDLKTEPLFTFSYKDDVVEIQGMVYRAHHDGPFQLQKDEIVTGVFLEMGKVVLQAKEKPFCPDGLTVLAEYQRWNRFVGPSFDCRPV